MPDVAPPSFRSDLAVLGVSLTDGQIERLVEMVGLLLRANEQMNLTAIRDWDLAWQRHVLDSLSLVPWLTLPEGSRVVDVGAGGGLPGLVLAIAKPELAFTLVDATGKKVQHIAGCARALSLDNVSSVHGRAEELAGLHGTGNGAHRERYDVGVARALAPMPVLLELVTPFVRSGGFMLALKGERLPEELAAAGAALRTLRCEVHGQQRTSTGNIVRVNKLAPTPGRYPRRSGEPKRDPIQ